MDAKLEKMIGIPFVDGGRSYDGADCYGTLVLYYRDVLGIDLPECTIRQQQPRKAWANFLKEISEHWEKIDKPEKDCVVAMKNNPVYPSIVTHFGVVIDDGKTVLHTLNKVSSHIVSIESMTIKSQIEGYYRWLS